LNKIQAFEAMRKFLEKYYERTFSDDVGSLWGDLQILDDGNTADPAAMKDWDKCIDEILDLTFD
jgi:hypothetical protein